MDFAVDFVSILTTILSIAIVGRSVLSWVDLGPSNPLVIIIFQITEPVLAPIRRVLPNFGGLDLSPLAAIVGLNIIRYILIRILS